MQTLYLSLYNIMAPNEQSLQALNDKTFLIWVVRSGLLNDRPLFYQSESVLEPNKNMSSDHLIG